MKEYKKTHPWLTFTINMEKAGHAIWMLLAEAKSKCEHIAGTPLRPATSQKLLEVYLAKGVLATTAIEGNTLSEEEVQKIIKGNLEVSLSREYLKQENENIIKACNLIKNLIMTSSSSDLSVEAIMEHNMIVLENLPLAEDVVPGQLRKHSVVVGRYRGAPPNDCKYLLERLCGWLNDPIFQPEIQNYHLPSNFLKAILAHLYLAWIHPFADGNGRTARLVEFQILLSAGVPAPAAHLLSNHYNQTRHEYYLQLDAAGKSGGNVMPFIRYALQGFVDGLKEQLDLIRKEQWNIIWRNYIHETFKDKTTKADVRRRRLVLDLSLQHDLVHESGVTLISKRVMEVYQGKTRKTLSRDLNRLVDMGLIERTPDGIRPKREIILAFLPEQRDFESKT